MTSEAFHFFMALICIILAAAGFALGATYFGVIWLVLCFLQCLAFRVAGLSKSKVK